MSAPPKRSLWRYQPPRWPRPPPGSNEVSLPPPPLRSVGRRRHGRPGGRTIERITQPRYPSSDARRWGCQHQAAVTIVGRVTELVALEGSLDRAAAGRADVVYLAG